MFRSNQKKVKVKPSSTTKSTKKDHDKAPKSAKENENFIHKLIVAVDFGTTFSGKAHGIVNLSSHLS